MAKYFGTNGVRGTLDFLGPELAMKVAQATGVYFNRGKVVVARDHRLTGELLRNAVCSGLQSVGCEVIDLGVVPAPTAEFMLKRMKANGLIIITASHNPPEYNALKVVDGMGISVSKERGEEIEKIMERVEKVDWNEVKNVKIRNDAIREHIDAIKKEVNIDRIRKRKLKLVLDCGNGTASLLAPYLFRKLGCEILSLHSHMDGTFPGRPSEPREENVAELMKVVKAVEADAGIAWDGDADRVIFVDENGCFVVGDRVFAICTLLELKKRKGNIITTVATSKAVENVGKKFGVKTLYCKVGAPYLSEEAAKGGIVIAGEEVGGVIFPYFSLAKDGFLAAAKVVEALTERKMSEWVEEIPRYYNEKTRVECDRKDKSRALEAVRKYVREKGLKTVEIDGVRVDLEDCWVIIRASGTEDYIRIFAEAKTKERARGLLEEFEGVVKSSFKECKELGKERT